MRWARCTGSAPFKGSSRTSTLRVGDERGGDLRALAHALAEPADPPIGDVEQPDGLERAVDRVRVGDAVQIGDVLHELASSEHRRHGFVLGHQGEAALHRPVSAGVGAEDA